MKQIILSLSIIALLAGCATKPMYRAAENQGLGYFHSKIGENRYRVHFKMKGVSRASAMDYALLRSAELTQEKGYDWFIVVESQANVLNDEKSATQNQQLKKARVQCGISACTSKTQPESGNGMDTLFGVEAKISESILEIRFGRGIRPQEGSSYDAQAVIDLMQERQFQD